MRWSDDIIESMDMSLSKFQEIVKTGIAKSWTWLCDWTTRENLLNVTFTSLSPYSQRASAKFLYALLYTLGT